MVGKWQAKSGLPKHTREGSNAPPSHRCDGTRQA